VAEAKKHLPAFWVSFRDGKQPAAACIEADDLPSALAQAEQITGRKPHAAETLPYPAEPRLNKHDGPWGICPSFCYRPERCAGNTSCRERRSCTD
jgi:hypothetical protein